MFPNQEQPCFLGATFKGAATVAASLALVTFSGTLRPIRSASPIRPTEQVTHSPPRSVGHCPPPQMLLAVVEHVAALAECLEIAGTIVGRVVVEVGRGQQHSRLPQPARAPVRCRQIAELSAPTIAPGALSLIPPAPVTQVADHLAMRAPALLASGVRPLEANDGRELAPVDRIEPAELRADRQGWIIVDAEAFGNERRSRHANVSSHPDLWNEPSQLGGRPGDQVQGVVRGGLRGRGEGKLLVWKAGAAQLG
jgi:hypothetical protein